MSTSREEMLCRTPSGTGQSLMKLRERPDVDMTLRTSMREPSGSMSSAARISAILSSRLSNSASTTQEAAPGDIMDASALAPARNDKAPSSMDFPAPVCPVIMTRPSGKSTSRESIRT